VVWPGQERPSRDWNRWNILIGIVFLIGGLVVLVWWVAVAGAVITAYSIARVRQLSRRIEQLEKQPRDDG